MHRAESTDDGGSSADSEPARRRFHLIDGMILVASSSITFVLLRTAADLGLFTPLNESSFGRILLEYGSTTGVCVLAPLVLALIVSILRDLRRNDLRGIGFVTCAIYLLAAIQPGLEFAIRISEDLGRPAENGINPALLYYFFNMLLSLRLHAGPMIAGAWLALALTGHWRVGSSWIDRVGFLVGACSILMYAHFEFSVTLAPLLP